MNNKTESKEIDINISFEPEHLSAHNLDILDNKIKITVLGKGNVGKGDLICRFINYTPPDSIIEDRYKYSLNIDGKEFELGILDTAGEEDYQNMMDMWVNFGEGFLLVFDINDPESFKLLENKHKRILKGKNGLQCPIILVGNKQDLGNKRKISYCEGKQLADSWGVKYIETCSKLNVNCKEVFENLSKKIIKYKAKNKSSKNCIII